MELIKNKAIIITVANKRICKLATIGGEDEMGTIVLPRKIGNKTRI